MFAYHLYKILPLSIKKTTWRLGDRILKPRLQKHFSQFISPGDLVFDIGAYIGKYTEIFLDLGARVVSVDPQPYSIKTLQEKFGDNPEVTIVNKGVGDSIGSLPFYISTNSRTNSTFFSKWTHHPRYSERKWDTRINVPITTLDTLIGEYGVPQFCKIDVEGFEPQVIRGLHQAIAYLSFEFDQEFMTHLRECVKHLSSLGKVKFNYALYGGSLLDCNHWLSADSLLDILHGKVNGHLRGDIYAKFVD